MEAIATARIGQLLDQRYRLEALLGQGAMGAVYRARHQLLGEPVAVKFLAAPALTVEQCDAFLEEARLCARLGRRCAQVVQLLDFGVEGQVPYHVMEYLPGRSLKTWLLPGPLALPRTLQFGLQIATGLAAAHRGVAEPPAPLRPIVHRDLKPANVLIRESDGEEQARLLDFGVAGLAGDRSGGWFRGTLSYAAPEQLLGADPAPTADVYSFGVLLYQMLTGQLPLQAEVPDLEGWRQAHARGRHQWLRHWAGRDALPRDLVMLVDACLAPLPGDRPSGGEALREPLAQLQTRFGEGLTWARRIRRTLVQLPVREDPGAKLRRSDPAELSRLQSWPADKPLAQIVFAGLLEGGERAPVGLWVMLPEAEVARLGQHLAHRQVLPQLLPTEGGGLLLWLTGLYSRLAPEGTPVRWLRCFLDRQHPEQRAIATALADQGSYQLLLFSLEQPQRVAAVIPITLVAAQQQALQQWLRQPGPPGPASPAERPGLLDRFEQARTAWEMELR